MVNAPVAGEGARHRGGRDRARAQRRLPHAGARHGGDRPARTRSVAGTLVGDGKPRLVEIKGIAVEADFAPHMLYVTNQDKPGFIGRFGMTLAECRHQHRDLPPRPRRAGRGRDLPGRRSTGRCPMRCWPTVRAPAAGGARDAAGASDRARAGRAQPPAASDPAVVEPVDLRRHHARRLADGRGRRGMRSSRASVTSGPAVKIGGLFSAASPAARSPARSCRGRLAQARRSPAAAAHPARCRGTRASPPAPRSSCCVTAGFTSGAVARIGAHLGGEEFELRRGERGLRRLPVPARRYCRGCAAR